MSTAVRALHQRPGLGLTANVVQQSTLRISRVTVHDPALILLLHGRKTLLRGGRRWVANQGDAIVVAGGQTLDLENRLSADGLFEARWLVWDARLLALALPPPPGRRVLADVAVLKQAPRDLVEAVARAARAIERHSELPDAIAEHQVCELFLWLAEEGLHLAAPQEHSLSDRLRGMIDADPAAPWTVALAAGHLATSEATLRRRLAAEGTTFHALLTEARM